MQKKQDTLLRHDIDVVLTNHHAITTERCRVLGLNVSHPVNYKCRTQSTHKAGADMTTTGSNNTKSRV